MGTCFISFVVFVVMRTEQRGPVILVEPRIQPVEKCHQPQLRGARTCWARTHLRRKQLGRNRPVGSDVVAEPNALLPLRELGNVVCIDIDVAAFVDAEVRVVVG